MKELPSVISRCCVRASLSRRIGLARSRFRIVVQVNNIGSFEMPARPAILYLSRFNIANKADYYRLLLEVTREGAWEPWVLFMLKAVEETARWTTDKILAIRALSDAAAAYVRERLPKIYSRELVDAIFEQPYCRIANLVDKGVAQRQAASRYLQDLVSIGVLREAKVGKEKLFIHPRLLQLLASDANDMTSYAEPTT